MCSPGTKSPKLSGVVLLLAVAWVMLASPTMIAQLPTHLTGKPYVKSAPVTKPREFDVFSIRPSRPDAVGGGFHISPDSYEAKNAVLSVSILMAYLPYEQWSDNSLKGGPDWINKKRYDIVAKVAPADVAEWQKQNSRHNPMLQEMLQVALAERAKLVLHRIPITVSGYALVVGKQGSKFKPTRPDEHYPTNLVPFPDGGGVIAFTRDDKSQTASKGLHFVGTSMVSLAAFLCGSSPGHPIFDRTGLTGKYDFVLPRVETVIEGNPVSLTDINPKNIWNLGALGLKLMPVKIPTEQLVIDHIEMPTAN